MAWFRRLCFRSVPSRLNVDDVDWTSLGQNVHDGCRKSSPAHAALSGLPANRGFARFALRMVGQKDLPCLAEVEVQLRPSWILKDLHTP